jgi:hypothetical protein
VQVLIGVVTSLTMSVTADEEMHILLLLLSHACRWMFRLQSSSPGAAPLLKDRRATAVTTCYLWICAAPLLTPPAAIRSTTQEMRALADSCADRSDRSIPLAGLVSFLGSDMAKFLIRLQLRGASFSDCVCDSTLTMSVRTRERRFLNAWRFASAAYSDQTLGHGVRSSTSSSSSLSVPSLLIWWRSLEVLISDTVSSVFASSTKSVNGEGSASSSGGSKGKVTIALEESVRIITLGALRALASLNSTLGLRGNVTSPLPRHLLLSASRPFAAVLTLLFLSHAMTCVSQEMKATPQQSSSRS